MRDLCAYFGVYYFSSQLDNILQPKEESIDKLKNDSQFMASVIFLEIAVIIQVCIIRSKRAAILKAQLAAGMIDEATANSSVFSWTFLSTFFNMLT